MAFNVQVSHTSSLQNTPIEKKSSILTPRCKTKVIRILYMCVLVLHIKILPAAIEVLEAIDFIRFLPGFVPRAPQSIVKYTSHRATPWLNGPSGIHPHIFSIKNVILEINSCSKDRLEHFCGFPRAPSTAC